jgi:hypothetical protein
MADCNISRNWILGGYNLEFEATYALRVGDLSDLIDGFLRTLGPLLKDGGDSDELKDFKGRDPNDLLLPGIAAPQTSELFRVGGVCAVEKSGDDFTWDPFEVVGYSPFKRFEGSHHIIHELQTERAGSLPAWLPTRLIGFAAPIKPKFFRYGLEHFESVLTFMSLGYSPQVKESFLLDCVTDTLVVRIKHEFRKRNEANLFERLRAYGVIGEILEKATGLSVRRDFEAALSRS